MATTQSKLAAYIGVERPAILAALGLPTDDQTGLEQLWEQFAQLTAKTGEGKTLSLVTEFPAEGDENTYYGLTKQVDVGEGPVTNPQAGVPFNAFLMDSPDLSTFATGQTEPIALSVPAASNIEADLTVYLASSVLANVTAGENSRFLQFAVTVSDNWLTYLDDSDGEVVADGTWRPAWRLSRRGLQRLKLPQQRPTAARKEA